MRESETPLSDDMSNDQLVAYLDGELDAESSLQIERRLAQDADLRRELQQLQRTWDMLDELPKSEVSQSFTQTTVEMVVLSAEQDHEAEVVSARRKSHSWWLLGAGGFVAMILAGYALMAWTLNRPQNQLLRDLPVIEDLELYRIAESVDYVHQLQESGLFDEEVEDAP